MLQIHTEYIVTKFKYKFVVISKKKHAPEVYNL